MFLGLRMALLALISLSAVGASARQSIFVNVTGPSEMDIDTENVKVLVTIINTGDEIINILNDPRGPLSTLPTNKFSITDTNNIDAQPAFSGIKVKYVPAKAAAAGDYTTLAPGQAAMIEHHLAEAYDFTSRGPRAYKYDIAPQNLFFIVNNDKDPSKITPIYADYASHTALVSWLFPPLSRPILSKRASFTNCTSDQQDLIARAAETAQDYATGASAYVRALDATTSRYRTWFGFWSKARHNSVTEQFAAIGGNNFSSYTYDCSCNSPNTYAYVYQQDFGHVYLCGAFWQAPMNGTDSKGGTLVHESSHFTMNAGGTSDITYGQAACEILALESPASAIDNADSHEYFAENHPFLT